MLVRIPDDLPDNSIATLTRHRDDARQDYFTHVNPGGLTPGQLKAWDLEDFALQLLFHAAEIRLGTEKHLTYLLAMEEKS